MSRLSFAVSQAAPNASDALSPFSKAPVAIIFICISPPSKSRRAIAIIARSLFLFCHAPAQSGRDSSGFGAPGRQKAKPVSTKSVHPTSPAAKPRHPIPILVLAIEPLSLSCLLPVTGCRAPPATRRPTTPERAETPLRNQDFSAWACLPIFENTERNRSAAGGTIPLSRRSGVECRRTGR